MQRGGARHREAHADLRPVVIDCAGRRLACGRLTGHRATGCVGHAIKTLGDGHEGTVPVAPEVDPRHSGKAPDGSEGQRLQLDGAEVDVRACPTWIPVHVGGLCRGGNTYRGIVGPVNHGRPDLRGERAQVG